MAATNLQKVTLNLRPGDWDYIESIYKSNGIPTSQVIRKIVSNFVDARKTQEAPVQLDLGESHE